MNEIESRFDFLGESPVRWALFIAALTVWLYVWGRIIAFLGGVE